MNIMNITPTEKKNETRLFIFIILKPKYDKANIINEQLYESYTRGHSACC